MSPEEPATAARLESPQPNPFMGTVPWERFAARSWSAMTDVMGEHAATSLLQYMIRTTVVDLSAASGATHSGLPDALKWAARTLPFSFRTRLQHPHRVELLLLPESAGALPDPPLRAAFLRGAFQGVLAVAPHASGWGVLVAERPEGTSITLSRGIA